MRLPADTVLLLGEAADPELQRVWREEGLAVAPLTAELEALDTATLVVAGADGQPAALRAAALGFRTFLVGGAGAEGVRAVSLAEALDGARNARARERWRAARAASRG